MVIQIGILGQVIIGESNGIEMHKIGKEMKIVFHSGSIQPGHHQQQSMIPLIIQK